MKISLPGRLACCLAVSALSLSVSLQAAETKVVRLSEPVERTNSYELYGERFAESGTPLTLAELVANSDQHQNDGVLVKTRIARVCQKKGCFFVATEGAATARISFKDYGFFIPTDSGGKQAILYGVFSRQPVSEAEAKHYADDLGESGEPNAGEFSYTIVATGVKILKS